MKTSIIPWLMLITLLDGWKGLAEGSIKDWQPHIPARLRSRAVTFRSFILHGTPAEIEDFPFKVSLRQSGEFFCGGTVIGWKWALTAGSSASTHLL